MLIKNVLKHVNRRLIQVGLLFSIMLMSAFIYVIMSHSLIALKQPTEAFFKAYNQEDFNVVVSDALTQSDFEALADFSVTSQNLSSLEKENRTAFEHVIASRENAFIKRFPNTLVTSRLHKDVYVEQTDSQHFMRVLKDSAVINQSYITKGTKPQNPSEIALIEVYANANNYAINDTIDINGFSFTITGFVLFPDYTLPLFSHEFILNNAMRTIALMSDADFDALNEPVWVTLAGVKTAGNLTDDTFHDSNLDFVMHTSLTQNTLRSGAIYDELAGAEAMSLILSLVIASIGVIITAVMVSRMLYEQQGAIGVLKALGYKNAEIARPYLLFVLVLSLPGLLLGYFLGFIFAPPLTTLYASIYLLPHDPIAFHGLIFAQSIILPLALLGSVGYVVILRLLRQDPMALIRPGMKEKPVKRMKRMKFLDRLSLLSRVKHAYVWRNKGRLVVFFTGVFTAIFLIFVSLSMLNIFDNLFHAYYHSIEVKYIAYCPSETECDLPSVTYDKVLELHYVKLQDLTVTVVGLDASNALHPLFEKGKNITERLDEAGVIITQAAAMQTGLKKGDMAEISYGSLSHRFLITGIQDELGAQKIYVNRQALSLLLTDNQTVDAFNTLYTSEPVEGNYATVLDVNALLEQSKDLSQMMNIMTLILTLSSVIMGVIVLLLILLLAIEHYHYDISLFKVMGYNDKEIRQLFIHSYFLYMLLIFVFTYPIAVLSFEIMMWYMATQYGMIFPMILTFEHVLYALLISISIFFFSLPIASKKIHALTLAEALKVTQNDA